MPSINFDNCVDSFEGAALSEDINKKGQEALLQAFNYTLDEDQCRSALSRNQENVSIARLRLNGRLALFDHLNETGGTAKSPNPRSHSARRYSNPSAT